MRNLLNFAKKYLVQIYYNEICHFIKPKNVLSENKKAAIPFKIAAFSINKHEIFIF